MELDVRIGVDEQDYFVFLYNSKVYFETGDFRECLLGPGPIIHERISGRFFDYGSAFSVENAVAAYKRAVHTEKEIRKSLATFDVQQSWTLVILKVYNEATLVEVLSKLGLQFVVPEVESGVTWRIPQTYTRDKLRDKLKALPAKFEDLSGHTICSFYRLNPIVGSCQWALLPSEAPEKSP